MREIGSEFWDVPTLERDNGLFPSTTQWFLSGRGALRTILQELDGCHSVAVPSWCCDSMIKPFADAGFEVSFYPVTGRTQELSKPDSDVLLVMDYFGFSGYSAVPDGYHGVVIRDLTHSLFSKRYDDADYFFGSLRKWCGVWTGGFALGLKRRHDGISDESYVALRREAMERKATYIAGETDSKDYLNVFAEAERRLENSGSAAGAERDTNLAKRLDVNFIRERRRENAALLLDAFREYAIFPELKEHDCPLFVPIRVPDGKRDALRRYLIDRKIYSPIHWPVSNFHALDERTRRIYAEELSLICDQRYTSRDMCRIIDAVHAFGGL